MCGCIEKMDGILAESNGRLSVTINFRTGEARPYLPTEKVESRKRVKPPIVSPTYCPFCGTKYDEPKAETTNG